MKTFSQLIRESSITQEELAKKLSVEKGTVETWQKGYIVPDIDHLLLLLEIFGFDYEELSVAFKLQMLTVVIEDKNEELKIILQEIKSNEDKATLDFACTELCNNAFQKKSLDILHRFDKICWSKTHPIRSKFVSPVGFEFYKK